VQYLQFIPHKHTHTHRGVGHRRPRVLLIRLPQWLLCTDNQGYKTDLHVACCASKGLECVFPIWFTQCGHVWFTLAMLHPCHALTMPFYLKATAQHGRQETACGLPARFQLLPATMRSSTKIVIISIPILLTTIHTYDCKEW